MFYLNGNAFNEIKVLGDDKISKMSNGGDTQHLKFIRSLVFSSLFVLRRLRWDLSFLSSFLLDVG